MSKINAKEKKRLSLYGMAGFAVVFAGLGVYFLTSSFAATATGTFGKTTIGASCDTFDTNIKRVIRYNLPVTGTITKLNLYLKPGTASGSQLLKGVIYADNNNAPAGWMASTAQLTYSKQAAGWYVLNFASPITIKAGNYWIGVLTGDTARVAGYCFDTPGSNVRDYNTNTYSSGPSNPFGTVSQDNRAMSLYATYTYTVADPPTVSLTANPTHITAGQLATLGWSSSNATSCSAPWISSSATSGNQLVKPTTATTYTITCSGAGGSAAAHTTITVSAPLPTPNPGPNPSPTPKPSPSPPPPSPTPPSPSPSPMPSPSPSPASSDSGGGQPMTLMPVTGAKQSGFLERVGKQKLLGVLAVIAALVVGMMLILRLRHKEPTAAKPLSLDRSEHDTTLPAPEDIDIPPSPFL